MFGAKRPFDTTKAIEDLKIFPAEVRNLHNKNVIMHCFFKRCIDDEEQFKQCLYCATRLFAPVTPRRSGEALVVECRPNLWWGYCKEDDLLVFLAKVEAAYGWEYAKHCADPQSIL